MPGITAPRVEGTVRVRGGRKLGFAEFGPHDGTPVVWFHGTPGARRQIPEPARLAGRPPADLGSLRRPGYGPGAGGESRGDPMEPAQVVDAFIAAIEAKDLDAALELVRSDVEYDNVPIGAVHGPDGVRSTLGPLLEGSTAVEWVVHRQVAAGDLVMNERTDRFQLGDRWIEVAVAGVFEVRDGRIALWRDYFDLRTFEQDLAGG